MIRKYIKDTKITFITQLIILIIGFIYSILIARILGPEGKGIATIAYLFPFIFSVIAGLGLDEGNIYMIAKDKNNHKTIFSNSFILGIIMSGISIFILYTYRDFFFTKVLKNLEYKHFIIITTSIPFFIFLIYSRALLQGHGDFVKFNLTFIIHHGLNFILCTFLIIKFKILGAIISILVSTMIAGIVVQFYLLPYGRPGPPNLSLLKSTAWFGIRNKAGFIIDFVNKRLDMFILNYFKPIREVGYYSISVSFAEILYKLPEAFGMTLFPKVAKLSNNEGNEFTSLILKHTVFLMFLGSILFALIIKPIIFLTVGKEFYLSITPFLILLPGIIFMGITRIITSNFQGQGKPEYGTYITAVSAIFTISLDLLLIPKYGMIGAAIASTISYFVGASCSILIFIKRAKIKVKDVILIQRSSIGEFKSLLK
ncbi:MAG: flippase [bacterium]|nr:flippase [bacterium]